jgi:hypothetical protein
MQAHALAAQLTLLRRRYGYDATTNWVRYSQQGDGHG